MKGIFYKKILAVTLAASLSATVASPSILASDIGHASEIKQDAEQDIGNVTVSDDTPLVDPEDFSPVDTENEENNAQINFSEQENLYESMEITPGRAGADIEAEKSVESIKVTTPPVKMTYLTERDNIDLYGMVLSITYTDKTTDTITINAHIGRFKVDNGGTVTSSLLGGVNNRFLLIAYENNFDQITLEKPDWEAESSGIEDEKTYLTDLTEEQPYRIYSFCPSETKAYNFFSFSDTSVETFVELYEKNGNDYNCTGSTGEGGEKNNFLLSATLNKDSDYYFIVSHRTFGNPAKFTCCLSSTISSLSDLEIKELVVTEPSKDTWYDFESDSIPVAIKGTKYKVTYNNGWEREGEVESPNSNGDEAEIFGKTLSARWKYAITDESGKSCADKDKNDNALIYTYEGQTTEFVFPVTFNAPSPVASISIERCPWQDWEPYQYQLVGNKDNWPSGQVSVKIRYTDDDGRDEKTVTWDAGKAGYEEEYDGDWIRVRLREGDDIQPGENAVVVSYKGKRAEIPITVRKDPVESIQILQRPEKTGYYPFEESVDLYGMKAQILYSNGKTQTVEVSEHTGTLTVLDAEGYGGELTSSLDSSKKVSISYIGYTEELTFCKEQRFTDEDSILLTEEEEKQTGLSEGSTYQIFSFTPSESAAYRFSYKTGGGYNITKLYNAANRELADTYSPDLNYEMVGGRIYYIALINGSRSEQNITCSISRQEAAPKEDISAISLSVDAPSAGNALPDLTEIEYADCYISDCSWLNDENNDKIADYGKKHQFEAVVRAKTAHQFTSSTVVEVNGEEITEKSIDSDGELTIRYTFPSYTQFQITIPQAEGYTLDESKNPEPGKAGQGGSYTFRYIKNTENDSIKLIVKAGDAVLTPDGNGTYVIENITQNMTVTVKQVNISADSSESILTLYDRNAVLDVLIGKRNTRFADDENGGRILPVLESGPDGSNQFFFGWYQDKDQDLNGRGTRFTSQSILADPQYSLYARWGKGTFSYKSDQEDVNCKIISIDESNGIKVEIGKIPPSEDGTIQIPEKIDWRENEDLKSLGIEFSHCTVTAISDNAFSGDPGIKQVSLPDTLEKIGENAFKGCTGLQEVSIPASVDTVPKGAFQGCTSLAHVRLEEGVTKIGASAFNGCDSLQTVILPDSLEEVHENAFDRNEKIDLVCSSDKKDSPVIKAVENITGASAATIDVEIDPPSDQMQFTYGGSGKTFTASVCVDGQVDRERKITWKYPVTQAYRFDVNEKENSLTVTPVQVTAEGEAVVIQAVDEKSRKYRAVTLTTKAGDDPGTPSVTPVPQASQILKSRYDSKGKRLKVTAGSRLTQVITGAKTNVTFGSSNSKIAKVGKTTGVIRFLGAGKVVITAKASETKKYKAASKKTTFYVIPRTARVKSLKSNKKGRVTIKGSNGAKDNNGYQILYKHNGKTRKVSVKGRKSVTRTFKNLRSGKTFKVKIRAYKKVGGVTYYGKYGKWKTLKRVK